MRARNIKPSLFSNELLAFADPIHTVIFAGLWCLADRRGVLEDRPQNIHLQINAGRALNVTQDSLEWLSENGFIARYAGGGVRLIKVIAFEKHQNPHRDEKPSQHPDYNASTVSAPCRHDAPNVVAEKTTVPLRLIPDSGSLIPDSLTPALPCALSVPGLDMTAWERWVEYRRKRKPAIKPESRDAAARELAAFGDQQAAAVEHSIANTYQGLFAPKPQNGSGQARAPNNDAARAEVEADAKAVGFRERLPNESLGSYRTSLAVFKQPTKPPPEQRRGLRKLDVSGLTGTLTSTGRAS